MQINSTRDVGSLYQNFLIYGGSGAGKTTLPTTVTQGKPLVLNAEGGLLSLSGYDIDTAKVSTMEELEQAYMYLAKDTVYGWVFLDSISEVAEVCLAAEKGKTKDGRQAFYKTQEKMEKIIRAFRDLPKNVVFIAKQDKMKDENTGAVLYAPSMVGQKLARQMPYYFDFVFCLQTWKDEQGNIQRAFQTGRDNQYEGKDRSGKLDFIEPANIQHIYDKVTNKGK